MNARYVAALALGGGLFTVAILSAASQGPAGNTVKQSPSSYPKPRNLKVLPKEISGEEIHKLMEQYRQYLGVPCGYCHAQSTDARQIDYASDEKATHSGFASPASGEFNHQLQQEFTAEIEKLLAEKPEQNLSASSTAPAKPGE